MMTINVYLVSGSVDWVSVQDVRGITVADFGTQAAAESFCRRQGYAFTVSEQHVG